LITPAFPAKAGVVEPSLCYDEFTGRFFYGTVDEVQRAANDVNVKIMEFGDASLNDFYDLLGLDRIPIGDDLGWSGSPIQLRVGSMLSSDQRPAISFWFHTEPKQALGH